LDRASVLTGYCRLLNWLRFVGLNWLRFVGLNWLRFIESAGPADPSLAIILIRPSPSSIFRLLSFPGGSVTRDHSDPPSSVLSLPSSFFPAEWRFLALFGAFGEGSIPDRERGK
jgi:hypothetical protein